MSFRTLARGVRPNDPRSGHSLPVPAYDQAARAGTLGEKDGCSVTQLLRPNPVRILRYYGQMQDFFLTGKTKSMDAGLSPHSLLK